MNGVGVVKEQSRSVTPSSYLGKRKRSASLEKPQINGISAADQHSTTATIDTIVEDLKQYDVSTSILEYPLPTPSTGAPSLKRQKTDPQDESVQARLARDHYSNIKDFASDVRQVLASMKFDGTQVNGVEGNTEKSDLDKIERLLDENAPTTNRPASQKDAPPKFQSGEVLTVRSNVEGGHAKQVFTGLRIRPAADVKLEDIDVRQLPSGFDVVEATSINVSQNLAQQVQRTFGDVFRPIRNVKPLEQPRPFRSTSNTVLSFQKPFESTTNHRRDDYRNASLSAGSWLDYSTVSSDAAIVHRQRQRPAKHDPQALFKASFSSFAPTEDNSTAVVPRLERSRRWYRNYGANALQKVMAANIQIEGDDTTYPEIDDDFQQLIDDFEPDAQEDLLAQQKADEEETEILDQVSELLQTLSSYQQIRDLDRNRVPDTPIIPTGPEMETFELLREQLSLLVAALPPFAVAKLDGDQLRDLNINPSIIVRTPDVAGTGQPDDGTLQRQRQAQAQAQHAAVPRPLTQPQPRNNYTSTTPVAPYGGQARYGANVSTPSMPGYAQRNAQIYNTPRPNVQPNQYSQTPSQRQQQPYPGVTIQQYQRMQNGYGQNVQTPYQPRASQTPYQAQSQMQSTMQFARSASPAKPMANGQSYGSQTPQPYSQRNTYAPTAPSNNLLQGPYAQANTHATIQQIKAAQQANNLHNQPTQSQSPQPQSMQGVLPTNAAAVQTQQQRQASGTPQPPSQSQTHQQQHADMAAIATASAVGNNLRDQGVQHTQRATATPTPPVAAGAGNT